MGASREKPKVTSSFLDSRRQLKLTRIRHSAIPAARDPDIRILSTKTMDEGTTLADPEFVRARHPTN